MLDLSLEWSVSELILRVVLVLFVESVFILFVLVFVLRISVCVSLSITLSINLCFDIVVRTGIGGEC